MIWMLTLVTVLLPPLSDAPSCAEVGSAWLRNPTDVGRAGVEAACTLGGLLRVLEADPPWSDLSRLPAGDSIHTGEGGFYFVDLPKDYSPDRPWPLIVSLHGNPPGHGMRVHRDYWNHDTIPAGFILISPDLDWGKWRSPEGGRRIKAALSDALTRFHVDPARIILAGYSSGGMGAWYHGTWAPELFAALNIRCGLRSRRTGPMRNLKNIGVYLMHALSDHRCAPSNARSAAKDMKKRGMDHEFITFPGDHDFYTPHNPTSLEWLRKQRQHDWTSLDYEVRLTPKGRFVRHLLLKGKGRSRVKMTATSNKITLTIKPKGKKSRIDQISLYLAPATADLDKPVTIELNGETVHNGKLPRTLAAFLDSYQNHPAYTPTRHTWLHQTSICLMGCRP